MSDPENCYGCNWLKPDMGHIIMMDGASYSCCTHPAFSQVRSMITHTRNVPPITRKLKDCPLIMKDYRSSHMVEYESPKSVGFCDFEFLHFLKGKPWDIIALNCVHALEPTCIRVVQTNGALTCDSIRGRVTVVVDKENIIREITKEVSVGLDGGFANAYELKNKLTEK
jgi:hypothetical protein